MAKVAKKIQTDYTTGGRDISNTAIPLYQQALTDIGGYNANTQGYIDDYLSKYFSNTSDQSDFLRNYQKATSQMTGSNAAATGGGYSSLNQQNYDDTQRYYNDLASRLQGQNVVNAANMAQQYYNNLLNSTGAYGNAYQLGKEYSDIEQWNNMANQANSFWNQLGGMASTVGTGLSAIPTGLTRGLGTALQVGGNLMTTDTSNYFDSLRGNQGGLSQSQADVLGKSVTDLGSTLQSIFNKNNNTTTYNQQPSSTQVDLSTPQSLYNTPNFKFSWQK